MNTANTTSLQAVGTNEKMASVDPQDYKYCAPTPQQQQQMYQQFVQMAFFCFSQMQMQNALCQGAPGQFPFPGTFMPGFPLPGFPNPAFCGMPPMPPGFFPMCPPPSLSVPPAAAPSSTQEVSKTAAASAPAVPATAAATNCSQQASAPSSKEVSCSQPQAQNNDPLMDCVMELSMDDIQKLFEDTDEPSATTTAALQAAVAPTPDSCDYPRASSPSGSLGSTNTNAASPAAAPAAASPTPSPRSSPAAAAQQQHDMLFSDLDNLDNLISVPNCPVAESCKLEQVDNQPLGVMQLQAVPMDGLFDGVVPELPAKAAAAKKLRAAAGGVRKQSARLKEKCGAASALASMAVQDAIEAVGDYLDSEEPADWEAMLFPMALDSELLGSC